MPRLVFDPRRTPWAWPLALACALAGWAPRVAWAGAGAPALERVAEQIEQLERDGEARPAESARELEALAGQPGLQAGERLEALTALGMVLAQAGDRSATERIAARLDRWPDGPERAAAHLASRLLRSIDHRAAGEVGAAGRLLAEAERRLAPDTPPRIRLRVLSARAGVETDAGRVEQAVLAHHAALNLANSLRLVPDTARLLGQLSYTYGEAGQLDRAAALLDEAFAAASGFQDDSLHAYLHNLRSIVLDNRGDRAGERAETLEAIRYATRAGNRRRQATMLGNLADSYLKTGEHAVALRYAQEAVPLAREARYVGAEAVAQGNAGLALIGLGRIEEGRSLLTHSIAGSRDREEWPSVAQFEREFGAALEAAGDARGAIEAYHRARRVSDDIWRTEQQRSLVELQARYDDERRERDMQALDADNRLKTEQLQRRDLEQRVWWMMSFAGLLTLALVALGAQRVRRTNAILRTTNAQLQAQSERDPLTGLANRRHLQTALPALSHNGHLQAGVLMIDIDHFKSVNERHGHTGGDTVLIAVAERLRSVLRDDDLVARWGGEEFLAVVRQRDPSKLEALAQRLLAVIGDAPVEHAASRIHVTASIGFASFPMQAAEAHAPAWERAVALVDAAMYRAKARGRNRACGVTVRRAPDAAAFDAVLSALETARADGRVALIEIEGSAAASNAREPGPAGARSLRLAGEAA